MENIDIEKKIIDNFYKIVLEDNPPQQEIERHITQIRNGIKKIKDDNNLEILNILYFLEKQIYRKIGELDEKIVIKDNGLFKDVATVLIFALIYEYHCYTVCFEKNLEDGKITLGVPKELEEKILKILDEISEEWNKLIKIEII